jgi:thioredoxin 1
MISRRSILIAAATTIALLQTGVAGAFEFKAYDQVAVDKAIASGKPVVVHVFAPWCLQCRAQEAILNRLSSDTAYDGASFFRVDYDNQKDVVKALNVPRSTLITYKGGAEVERKSWGTSQQWVVDVLASVS